MSCRRCSYCNGKAGNVILILCAKKKCVNVPVSLYQVSGEYAMVQRLPKRMVDHDKIMIEQLHCIKRAGAILYRLTLLREAYHT